MTMRIGYRWFLSGFLVVSCAGARDDGAGGIGGTGGAAGMASSGSMAGASGKNAGGTSGGGVGGGAGKATGGNTGGGGAGALGGTAPSGMNAVAAVASAMQPGTFALLNQDGDASGYSRGMLDGITA